MGAYLTYGSTLLLILFPGFLVGFPMVERGLSGMRLRVS